MKSYDNPEYRSYNMGLVDIGAGTAPDSIPVPAGATGARIVGAAVGSLTEAFTADTTGGGIQIGTAADPNKFFDAVLPVIALTDSHDYTRPKNTMLVMGMPTM